jgi:hypothetical protein
VGETEVQKKETIRTTRKAVKRSRCKPAGKEDFPERQ